MTSKTSKALKINITNGDNYDEDWTFDGDTCTYEELQSVFNKPCTLLTSKKIFSDKKYILHLDATRETDPSIVIASNTSVDILKLSGSQLAKTNELNLAAEEECVGTKFAPMDSNLVYIACSKANIKLYDLRTPEKPVSEFIDSTVNDKNNKTFLSFDVSPDNKLVTAGTELFDADAFVLFWDVRNANLLGAYWESHTDDVMQVKFHAEDRNKLLSASTDGLINMYNLKEASEDDALTECLNTESSVEQIAWCNEEVFCATHTHNVQMWRLEDATPYGDFKREILSQHIKRKCDDYNYVAGCFVDKEQPVILFGSNFKDGECLRALAVDGKQLRPLFDCRGNSQRVRSARFDPQSRILMTGGEKGIIDVWKLDCIS
ncbi:LOW QUALITY PROTEIN: WD repeat-containing protein 89 [Atheta coriaria]|uniref:LOW QUALITY PROTEIN: WD repeat-containing protein 89 n=1 Tax=Dalotia coriaria TaxID=877792 RepID=UPI0031F3AD6F